MKNHLPLSLFIFLSSLLFWLVLKLIFNEGFETSDTAKLWDYRARSGELTGWQLQSCDQTENESTA